MYLLISYTFWEIGNTFRFLKTGHELPRWGKHSIWDSERRLSTRCSCNGDNPRIMHSTHVFIAQSRLSLTTRYFRDLLRSRPYTYGSARVKVGQKDRHSSASRIADACTRNSRGSCPPGYVLPIDPSFSPTYVFNPD